MNLSRPLLATTATVAISAIAFLTIVSCSSFAHDASAMIGDVTIDSVAATPARAGGTTRVTFRVENNGAERLVVTGVRLSTGEPWRVVGFLGTGHSTTIGGFPVAAGETGDLDGKSAWVEIGPLKEDLEPGALLRTRLVFGVFEAPLVLHVSPERAVAPRQVDSIGNSSPKGFKQSRGPDWLRSIRC